MDRVDLPEDSIHEVGMLFEAALRAAAAELSVADLNGIERRLQAVGRTVLGEVVERVLALRAAARARSACPTRTAAGRCGAWTKRGSGTSRQGVAPRRLLGHLERDGHGSTIVVSILAIGTPLKVVNAYEGSVVEER